VLKLRQMKLTGFKSFFQRTELHFPDGITAVVGPNGCGKSNISDAISWVLGEQSSKSLRGTKMEDVIFNGSEKRGPLPMAEVSLTLAWSANGNGNGNGHAPVADALPEDSEFQARPEVFEAARAATDTGDTEQAAPTGELSEADASAAAADATGSGNGHAPAPVFTIPTEEGAEVRVTRRLFRNGESEYRIDDKRVRLRDVQDLMQSARIGSRTYAVIEQDRISALLSARPKERKEMIEEAAGILGIKARKRAALL
jgi:chromosome segregation protein